MLWFSRVARGISYIEMVIGLLIVAIIAGFGISRSMRRAQEPLDLFTAQLSRLTQLGYTQALLNNKIYRILFQLQDERQMILEVATGKQSNGALTFGPVAGIATAAARAHWDAAITIDNFYVHGVDELARGGTRAVSKDCWFLIMPSGLAQDVVINCYNEESGQQRGLVLNPFTVSFEICDERQKP